MAYGLETPRHVSVKDGLHRAHDKRASQARGAACSDRGSSVPRAGGRAAFSCVGRDSNFNPHRLLTLRTRNSAAYKGIYALLNKVAVDRVRNQEYVVPGDGSEDDRCGGQDAVYDE